MSLEFLLFQSTQEPELMIVTNVGLGNTMSPSEEAFTCHREARPELTATNAVKAKHYAHRPIHLRLPCTQKTLNKYLLNGPANE